MALVGEKRDIGGRALFARVGGVGQPAVIFDAGHGDSGDSWAEFADAVAAHTRVLTYDRAGLGHSDRAALPRTSRQLVEGLRALLAVAAIAPPYVLVGHSFGGLTMHLYARVYPEEVAGLVLLDATHADLADRLRAVVTPEEWARFEAGFPPSPEGIDRQASWAEVQAAPPLRADLPLAVVVAVPPAATQFPPRWPIATFTALWQVIQEEQARASLRGWFARAEGAGHYVHHDRPDLALAAILRVVAEARHDLLGNSSRVTQE